jgi:DNA-binding CsgD family transcriptional regulator
VFEVEILSIVAESKSGPEISILLCISHDTARNYMSRIFEKLDFETRAAAASVVREFARKK